MSILPFVLIMLLGFAWIIGWAVVNVARAVRAARPVRMLHGAALLATTAGVGLIWFTACSVYAALGHSTRWSPGIWVAVLAGGFVCFILPGGALALCRHRRLKRERSPKG
ncbi:MAG TPA: hypothetical protein PLY66_12070 [Acidobacteriota bacterium]|nr:hypothetical protein [Acidobacteriota bacterium]HQF88390.1 hypothetical protein [Acidobacteriota bacterium]HQG92913.1 hypothetical protein [Acidobacteriota bacterium]HQK88189.1 hypothetical protein [Acidobacteriota bacterium]